MISNKTNPILRETSLWLLPVFAILSIFLLLRGHHLPGGGFAGGLVAATGFAFVAVVRGPQVMRRLIGVRLDVLIASGLLISLFSAALPVLFGQTFFTGMWTKLSVLPGEAIKVGTPLLFDVGVYLVVLGVGCNFIAALMPSETDFDKSDAPAMEPQVAQLEGEQ